MSPHEQIAQWLREARFAVAFTGAGISTESGIPDFRSPGGVWSQNRPVLYNEFVASEEARHEYWRQKAIAHRDFAPAVPNVGHTTLARWQQQGRLARVLTQNIDGLHQAAGSTDVVELHGTALFVACLDCPARYEAAPLVQRFLAEDRVPPCAGCGGRLKHATISFGQALDPTVLQTSFALSKKAELYLAIGSSLVVEPAATLPLTAKRYGSKLVIINRDPTPLDDQADLFLREGIGGALERIDRLLRET